MPGATEEIEVELIVENGDTFGRVTCKVDGGKFDSQEALKRLQDTWPEAKLKS